MREYILFLSKPAYNKQYRSQTKFYHFTRIAQSIFMRAKFDYWREKKQEKHNENTRHKTYNRIGDKILLIFRSVPAARYSISTVPVSHDRTFGTHGTH